MTAEVRQNTDRAKLEAAVGKVAKAQQELMSVIEKSAGISEADVTKSFNFLDRIQADTRQKALLSIKTANAANGGFSLDNDYEPATPTARPERLVGQKNKKPVVPPVEDDGVDFLDE